MPPLQDKIYDEVKTVDLDIAGFGERFVSSKYGRPYRYKNRKFRANFRSGNKKKNHQYL